MVFEAAYKEKIDNQSNHSRARQPPQVVFVDPKLLQVPSLKPTSEWVPDNARKCCSVCTRSFGTLYRRKHHCRLCGEVVCLTCSKKTDVRLSVGQFASNVRVCNTCMVEATDNTIAQRELNHRRSTATTLSHKEVHVRDLVRRHSMTTSEEEPMFTSLANILGHGLDVPVALVLLLDAKSRGEITGTFGLSEPHMTPAITLCADRVVSASAAMSYAFNYSSSRIKVDGKVVSFMAGVPIVVNNVVTGVVLAFDFDPNRMSLSETQKATLRSVSKITGKNIELRLSGKNVEEVKSASTNVVDIKVSDSDIQKYHDLLTQIAKDVEEKKKPDNMTVVLPAKTKRYVLPTIPSQFREAVRSSAAVYEDTLIHLKWKWFTSVDGITLSMLPVPKSSYTRGHVSIGHHIRAVWSKVVDLGNEIYSDVISRSSLVETLNSQNAKYSIKLVNGGRNVNALLHWRVNRDGSVLVLVLDTSVMSTTESGIVLGWKLCESQSSGNVEVTCMSKCEINSAGDAPAPGELNQVCALMKRLVKNVQTEMVAPYVTEGPLENPAFGQIVSASSTTASPTKTNHTATNIPRNNTTASSRSSNASRSSSINGPSKKLIHFSHDSKSVNASELSMVQHNNQMFFDLLNQALETQKHIAMQQESILETITRNSSDIESLKRTVKLLSDASEKRESSSSSSLPAVSVSPAALSSVRSGSLDNIVLVTSTADPSRDSTSTISVYDADEIEKSKTEESNNNNIISSSRSLYETALEASEEDVEAAAASSSDLLTDVSKVAVMPAAVSPIIPRKKSAAAIDRSTGGSSVAMMMGSFIEEEEDQERMSTIETDGSIRVSRVSVPSVVKEPVVISGRRQLQLFGIGKKGETQEGKRLPDRASAYKQQHSIVSSNDTDSVVDVIIERRSSSSFRYSELSAETSSSSTSPDGRSITTLETTTVRTGREPKGEIKGAVQDLLAQIRKVKDSWASNEVDDEDEEDIYADDN